MRDKVFRSRGIRLHRNHEGSPQEQQKIYYEPNGIRIDQKQLCAWVEKKALALFEYSEIGGKIDTYNFHVRLENEQHRLIYSGLDVKQLAVLDVIPTIFDASFRNYTIGYQIDNGEIVRSTYYYYPTIWKTDHYGIKGISDTAVILEEIPRFLDYVDVDKQAKEEIEDFGRIMYKFKGLSVHFDKVLDGYKIYGRCDKSKLQALLEYRMNVDLEKYKYGEVVLVAQRIQSGRVEGYNLYFME